MKESRTRVSVSVVRLRSLPPANQWQWAIAIANRAGSGLQARSMIYIVEARTAANYAGRRQHRHVQQDAGELSKMVQDLRRPCPCRPSPARVDGCVLCYAAGLVFQTKRSRELCRERPAHQGRSAQVEGFPQRNGWFGRPSDRVAAQRALAFSPWPASWPKRRPPPRG